MTTIFQNIREILPVSLFFWTWLLWSVKRKPQRMRNSLLLMTAVFLSFILLAGLFGDFAGFALLVIFLLTMLALFSVPVLLILNGLQMIKRESRSIANLLSLLLGIFIAVGEIAATIFVLGFFDNGKIPMIYPFTFPIFAAVFYVSVLILNFVAYTVFIQFLPYRRDFQYIIIHGCGLIHGNQVSKLLADRIDKSIAVWNACGKKPYLIPSGGMGGNETLSEAAAMKAYLLEKGVPEEYILSEDRSKTTYENLLNSYALIESHGGCQKHRIALISSNYHVYRCLMLAEKVGMTCMGIGAGVAPYFFPSAVIRECVAVYLEKKNLIAILIGSVFTVMIPSALFIWACQ